MEIFGWISLILLCALALTFIILTLGPVIHSEVSFWKQEKERSIEAKEDKFRFKKEMRDLKYKAKKLAYMKKMGLDAPELVGNTTCVDTEAEDTTNDDVVEEVSVDEVSEVEINTVAENRVEVESLDSSFDEVEEAASITNDGNDTSLFEVVEEKPIESTESKKATVRVKRNLNK